MEYNRNGGIDLHIHSTASDGTFTPAEILAIAQDLNLSAISITDHDTTRGSIEAIQKGIPDTFDFLTGVEISAAPPSAFPGSGSFHILGYDIDIDNPDLSPALARLQQARKNRNPRIIECLNNLGIDISLNDVITEVGKGQIGRPHIARTMVAKGFSRSINDAFDTFLGKGKPAYVDKYRIDCAMAISLITMAGGIPVLAHPALLNIEQGEKIETLIKVLIEMGLKGIEVFYPEHSPNHIAQYTKLANRHDLLITGGTDFHGSLNPEIQMGSGKGDMFIPYGLYKNLKETALQYGLFKA